MQYIYTGNLQIPEYILNDHACSTELNVSINFITMECQYKHILKQYKPI